MAKKHLAPVLSAEPLLRSYDLPLKGQLLLACGKCQRKLKKGDDPEGLGSLRKLLKQQAKADPLAIRLRILRVPCLKMCPKGGVTVMTAGQVERHECSIVRTAEDVADLYAASKAERIA